MTGGDVAALEKAGVLRQRPALGDQATVALGWMQARLASMLFRF
jgi:hypothetical protein